MSACTLIIWWTSLLTYIFAVNQSIENAQVLSFSVKRVHARATHLLCARGMGGGYMLVI